MAAALGAAWRAFVNSWSGRGAGAPSRGAHLPLPPLSSCRLHPRRSWPAGASCAPWAPSWWSRRERRQRPTAPTRRRRQRAAVTCAARAPSTPALSWPSSCPPWAAPSAARCALGAGCCCSVILPPGTPGQRCLPPGPAATMLHSSAKPLLFSSLLPGGRAGRVVGGQPGQRLHPGRCDRQEGLAAAAAGGCWRRCRSCCRAAAAPLL